MTQSEAMLVSIRGAQLLMKREQAIDVDGKWGSFTQSVYEKLSPTLRATVDQMLAAGGTSASELRAARAAQKAAGMLAQQSATDVKAIIIAAANEAGLDPATALGFASIESNFNPKAVNGSSRGLMQMQPNAWADARKILPDLPSYEDGVFDARSNARAGIAYIKSNARAIRRLGYTGDFTPAVAYMAHQQGAAGFVELWKAASGLPSSTKYVKDESMVRNPPPDGKGATTDKKEFFTRWMTVAKKKIDNQKS